MFPGWPSVWFLSGVLSLLTPAHSSWANPSVAFSMLLTLNDSGLLFSHPVTSKNTLHCSWSVRVCVCMCSFVSKRVCVWLRICTVSTLHPALMFRTHHHLEILPLPKWLDHRYPSRLWTPLLEPGNSMNELACIAEACIGRKNDNRVWPMCLLESSQSAVLNKAVCFFSAWAGCIKCSCASHSEAL